MSKLLDFILYPKKFYERLNDKSKHLIWGVILVGFIDILLFSIDYDLFRHFTDRPLKDFILNILIILASIIVLGILDVFFVSIPLSDIFYNFCSKKDMLKKNSARIVFMKIYICSHFIIAPASAIVDVLFKDMSRGDSTLYLLAFVIIQTAIMFWSSALLTRGTKILYGYTTKQFDPILFMVIFAWSNIVVGRVLYFIASTGLPGLLR